MLTHFKGSKYLILNKIPIKGLESIWLETVRIIALFETYRKEYNIVKSSRPVIGSFSTLLK